MDGLCRRLAFGYQMVAVRGVVAETFEHKMSNMLSWIGHERVRRSSADDLGAHEYLMERLCRGSLCSKVSGRCKTIMSGVVMSVFLCGACCKSLISR